MRLTVYERYTGFALMSLGFNVAFGSKADICTATSHARFTSVSFSPTCKRHDHGHALAIAAVFVAEPCNQVPLFEKHADDSPLTANASARAPAQ